MMYCHFETLVQNKVGAGLAAAILSSNSDKRKPADVPEPES